MAIKKVITPIDTSRFYLRKSGIILFSQRYSYRGKNDPVNSKQYQRWKEYDSPDKAIFDLKNNRETLIKQMVEWLSEDAVDMHFKGFDVHSNLIYLNNLQYGYQIDSFSDKDIKLLISECTNESSLNP